MNIAIIGASKKRAKFGNKAVRAYMAAGHMVFPVNQNESEIEGLKCFANIKDIPDRIDRVSMYTNPVITLELLGGIAEKRIRELYLNPGSESDAVIRKAESLGLNIFLVCSILAIKQNPNDFA